MTDYKWYPDDYQGNLKREAPCKAMVVYERPRGKQKKASPWRVAVITALVTSLLCTGAFTALLFSPILRDSLGGNNGTVVIYRDGEDLRNKVDITSVMNQVGYSADGQTPLSGTDIAERVGPAVVGIINQTEVNSFLSQTLRQGSGSGIILSPDGYIVTNKHVVENATEVTVILSNQEEYSAKLIGADSKTDIAVIKIEARDLPIAVLGNSDGVQVGELAIAIGNPLGQELAGSLTGGMISAVNRSITVEGQAYTLLQTDAAINPGNSGGALVNAYGEVIGINSVKMAASGVEGLGFAIPSNIVKPVIGDLIEFGYVQGRPLIGVSGRAITPSMSRQYGYPEGIYVVEAAPFSAAEAAGIKTGDVIVRCNGIPVKTVDELNAIRDEYRAGDTITLTISRNNIELDVDVILKEDKPEPESAPRTPSRGELVPYNPWDGFNFGW